MTEKERFDKLYQTLSINGQLMHVHLLLDRAAHLWPDKTAVICDDEEITYKQLFQRASLFCHHLRSLGVEHKDRVILFYENSIEFFIAYFGIWQAGAIVAPLNVFLHEQEFAHIVVDAKPKAIVISETQKSKISALKEIPTIIDKSGFDFSKEALENLPAYTIPTFPLDDLVALLYTSGTTGFPKAVMMSSRTIATNAIQGIARLNARPDYRIYCGLPLFHSLPQNLCVWANIINGSTAITGSKLDRRSVLNGIAKKPTIVVAIPALYGIFCLMKTIPFEGIEHFFSGGDVLSDKIRSWFSLIYRRKICNGYGLTETSPFIAVDIDDFTQPTNTVGKPFIGISCAIRDDTNNNLPQGEIGVLWVKGDNVMLGYYGSPQQTAAVLQNGWFCTGDLAYIDKNQKIVLAGRQKDLIIHKGIKIYPQEVENQLLTHPQVIQAAVIGISHHGAEIPIAFIASRAKDTKKLVDELRNLSKHNLAIYKVPHEFIVKAELPVTTTGKVDKKKLKAEFTEHKK